MCNGATAPILSLTSPNGITGTWLPPSVNNATSGNYVFTPNASQCASNVTLAVTIQQLVTPNFPINLSLCSGGMAPTLNLTSPNGISGTWLPPSVNTSTSGNYVFTPNAGQCASNANLNVTINNNTTINNQYYICQNSLGQIISPVIITSGLSSFNTNFNWTYNGNPIVGSAPNFYASTTGNYVLTATNMTSGCKVILNATVDLSTAATATAIAGPDFQNQQQIIVTVTGGLGQYEYQLDNGLFQDSNVFNVTNGGEYTLHVNDKLGCNDFILKVVVLQYPHFFTPNNDGVNDTWNVFGFSGLHSGKIYIFDRYGKLLKEILPSGNGWDGNFNGQQMFADDYWFQILYSSTNSTSLNKEFKAHFTLKR